METGASAVVGRGLVEILPDFRKWGRRLAADMRLARTQLDGSAAGLKASAATVGKSMAMVGKGTTALGLGVAAVSVKMAADFQSHTAVLQTAAGETTKGLKVVREGIKNIAMGTGTGIQNLTDGMYTIEKAGFRGADGLKVLKAAAQGAREENAKLSDVTNAMTSVMASYHLKATDSVRVMNAMKTAAGEGKITMEEFSGALSTVLPIASANKIKFEDIAGSMATLTQHGTSAREATHELAATIRSLSAPNNVAIREMGRFGLSAQDVSTKLGKRGLSGTANLLVETILHKLGPAGVGLMKAFEGSKQSAAAANTMIKNMSGEQAGLAKEYLKGKMIAEDWNSTLKGIPVAQQPALRNFKTLVDRSRGFSLELKKGGPQSKTFTDALKKMSGGAIGLNTILQITGESAEGNAERIKKVGESFHNNSKNVEGWKQTSKLLNVQLDRMKAGIQVLAINLGTKLIPVVSAVVGWFLRHKTVLLALVAAVGLFITTTAAAYVGMKLYAAGTAIATAATGAYNLALAMGSRYALATRIQLAALFVWQKAQAAGTAIATAAQWAWNIAMDANPIGAIILGIMLLVGVVVLIATKTKWFQKLWGWIWGAIRKPVMWFVNWLKNNWQLVVWGILTGGIGLAVAWIVRHWDLVSKAFSTALDWLKTNWPLVLALITGPIGLAVYWVVKHWKMISQGAQDAYHAVVDWFVRMGKDIGGFFSKLPGQIADFFSKLPGQVGGWLTGVGKSIGSFFSKLPGEISKSATGWKNALVSNGADLVAGLWKGATDFFTKSVPDFFKTLWHGIVDFFKVVFGIHSPSTVMASLGVDLLRGLITGMLKIALTVGTWLKEHIFNPVTGFFRNAGTWLVSKGRSTVLGLLRGWLNIANTIHAWLVAHIYNPVTGFFRNAGSWLVGKGRSTIYGLIAGLAYVARTIRDWFSSHVKGPITGAFKYAGTWLGSYGRSVISGLLAGFKDKWKAANTWVRSLKDKVVKAITDVFKISSPAKTMIPLGFHILAGLMKGILSGKPVLKSAVKSIFHSVTDVFKHGGSLIGDIFGDLGGAIGLGSPGGVQRWGPTVIQALRLLGQPVGLEGLVLRRLAQESGGNPGIVNKWDSNWKAGHPSVGLMQVIGPTFRAYAGRFRKTGPFLYGTSINPMANIYAGLNYALHRYGSLRALSRPGGYDSGGIARGVGYMPKWTTKPERVLSPRQTEAFENLVGTITRGASGGGGTTLVIDKLVLENHGVIASKREAEDWLVTGLTTLKKKNRLP